MSNLSGSKTIKPSFRDKKKPFTAKKALYQVTLFLSSLGKIRLIPQPS
jgi:hypothetical protein